MTDRHKNIIPDHELDENENFEKIRRAEKPFLPTSSKQRARRTSKETPSSKKVRKSISTRGGMHRRRQKKVI